jgi:hypothetical protein
MQTEPNTDLLYFNGSCPACSLSEKQQQLPLNRNDFWECEACRLQLTTFASYAAILGWRGEGKFRETVDCAHNHHDKLILTGVSLEAESEILPIPREAFYHRLELEDYLESIYNSEEPYKHPCRSWKYVLQKKRFARS